MALIQASTNLPMPRSQVQEEHGSGDRNLSEYRKPKLIRFAGFCGFMGWGCCLVGGILLSADQELIFDKTSMMTWNWSVYVMLLVPLSNITSYLSRYRTLHFLISFPPSKQSRPLARCDLSLVACLNLLVSMMLVRLWSICSDDWRVHNDILWLLRAGCVVLLDCWRNGTCTFTTTS